MRRLLPAYLTSFAILGGIVAGASIVLLRGASDVRAQAAQPATQPARTGTRSATTEPTTSPSSPEDAALVARGLTLYNANCSTCHGPQGLGDGPAAYLLYPKPRNFRDGQFRVTSANSGLPTDQDLLDLLTRGMPGSAMPSWGHLPQADRSALVRAVRELALQAKVAQITAANKTMKPQRAQKLAHDLLDPGPIAPIPQRPPDEKISVARGKELYTATCASCHSADGRGRDKRDLVDNSGLPIFARDFTAGIFKGGSDPAALARRITLGMPGSPMPAAGDLTPEDLWSLVAYVQTFIKPGAQQRVEQVFRTLVAKRVSSNLSIDPGASVWNEIEGTFIPIMPLWWRDDRIEGVTVRAAHDGKRIAIQLSWDDATANDLAANSQSFTDGAALQLAAAENPPLFAMGQRDVLVNIWHWKATRQYNVDTKSAAIDAQYPNAAHDEFGMPDYQTAAAAKNLVATTQNASSVECLLAGGFGTLSSRSFAQQTAQGGARRTPTGWSIVYLHNLGAEEGADEISLLPGGAVSIAFAAWDGAAGDRNGQKSVSIWHRLELQK